MIRVGRHGSVPAGDAVEGQPHLSVLAAVGRLAVQQRVGGVRRHAVGRRGRPLVLAHGHGERGQADADVLEGVQQEDAHDDGEEAAQRADDIASAHVLPLLEEDGRAGEHRRGEEHVVDGRHQRRVENVQRLVQVVDLRADAGHQPQQQDPGQRVAHHAVAGDRLLDGDAQSFDAGDRQRADHRADGDVDQDVGLAVAGAHHEDEDEGHDDDQGGEDEEAWRGEG